MSATSLCIEYDYCATPFGDCLVARTPRGLCRLEFTDDDRDSALARLAAAYPGAQLQPAELSGLVRQVFKASGALSSPPVDVSGTPFQRRVWRALQAVPSGSTCSYGDLARAIGRPGAARAVGRAVASNPVAVLVPCHRVLPATGGPGGYRWGPDRKTALLRWEAARAA